VIKSLNITKPSAPIVPTPPVTPSKSFDITILPPGPPVPPPTPEIEVVKPTGEKS
jgi:hypothetical protein